MPPTLTNWPINVMNKISLRTSLKWVNNFLVNNPKFAIQDGNLEEINLTNELRNKINLNILGEKFLHK